MCMSSGVGWMAKERGSGFGKEVTISKPPSTEPLTGSGAKCPIHRDIIPPPWLEPVVLRCLLMASLSTLEISLSNWYSWSLPTLLSASQNHRRKVL